MHTPEQAAYERAVQYLSNIQHIDNMINIKQEQIDSLRAKAGSAGAAVQGERVQGSGYTEDSLAECCARIADLCEEINRDIDRLADIRIETMRMVDSLDDLAERRVLYHRYFQYLPFSSIARRMRVSESTVYRLHRRAVKNFMDILKVDSP
jgi:DNA-directed RNA polymerase specialized sigma subunit